jgi:hypothetical protein
MARHKFKVGQLVEFAPARPGVPTSGRPYEVVGFFPPRPVSSRIA